MSVAIISPSEPLRLQNAALREIGRSSLEGRWLLLSWSASGVCHAAAIVLLVSLSYRTTTTDSNLSGRQSLLTVSFVDAPPVENLEFTSRHVEIQITDAPPPFKLLQPNSTPVTRSEAPPPVLEPTMAILDATAFLETTVPISDLPPRADALQVRSQPAIADNAVEPTPRRAPARPPAPTVVAITAIPTSARTTTATLLENPLPKYPAEALRRSIHGRVMLRVTVSVDGAVSDLEVAQTSGHHMFDAAALKAVQRWRFEPARRDGRPVMSTVLLPIRFLPP